MTIDPSKSDHKKKKYTLGRVYIKTYKNTHVTITDPTGAIVLFKSSCGAIKSQQGQQYKNTKKHKPQAAQVLLQAAGQFAKDRGMAFAKIIISGDGPARDMGQISHLFENGLQALEFIDNTPIPHGGCRKPKKPSK
jgi:small subunit ribosomal protein S11